MCVQCGGFYDWLAGLIDGEASFTISHKKGGPWFHPRMGIKLRDDDEPIIRYIHMRTGFGTVHRGRAPSDWPNSHPQIVWQVADVEGCYKLVQILDTHPLRSKKLASYMLWREIVIDKFQHPIKPGPKRGEFRTEQDRDNQAALKQLLTNSYEYRSN